MHGRHTQTVQAIYSVHKLSTHAAPETARSQTLYRVPAADSSRQADARLTETPPNTRAPVGLQLSVSAQHMPHIDTSYAAQLSIAAATSDAPHSDGPCPDQPRIIHAAWLRVPLLPPHAAAKPSGTMQSYCAYGAQQDDFAVRRQSAKRSKNQPWKAAVPPVCMHLCTAPSHHKTTATPTTH